MSSVCFYVSKNIGIKVKLIFYELFYNKSFLLFVSLSSLSALLLKHYLNLFSNNIVFLLILKSVIFLFFAFIILLLTYPKHLILNVKKILNELNSK